jgi:hypothetical protein
LISPARLALVVDRTVLAVVSHPGHQILETCPTVSGKLLPSLPEIMKVQAFDAYCPDDLRRE